MAIASMKCSGAAEVLQILKLAPQFLLNVRTPATFTERFDESPVIACSAGRRPRKTPFTLLGPPAGFEPTSAWHRLPGTTEFRSPPCRVSNSPQGRSQSSHVAAMVHWLTSPVI